MNHRLKSTNQRAFKRNVHNLQASHTPQASNTASSSSSKASEWVLTLPVHPLVIWYTLTMTLATLHLNNPCILDGVQRHLEYAAKLQYAHADCHWGTSPSDIGTSSHRKRKFDMWLLFWCNKGSDLRFMWPISSLLVWTELLKRNRLVFNLNLTG